MGCSTTPSVEELVRREVPDWDDEAVSTSRFKAFSGQRSDWEPRYVFWRDLIVKVARGLGVCTIRSSEVWLVKNVWFARGGLTPLCTDRVLLEMYNNGDILLRGDLRDPTSGRLYQIIRRVGHLIGISKSSAFKLECENSLILRALLKDRAGEVIRILADNHWNSNCIITLRRFQSICGTSDEASAILSYLSECGKAKYFSITKTDFIEGVKFSLVTAPVSSISSLDCDVLQLVWTTERLQQQLDVIDQRWVLSRHLAIASLKSGNKQAAYRQIRRAKIFSESRKKCTSLLERVEEVISIIADAESTKKVSEAIQIGARAIKENSISVEEVCLQLQELDGTVASQKQVDEALESIPLQYEVEDEDVEEEFKKLEMELGDDDQEIRIQKAKPIMNAELEESNHEEPTELLSQSLSKLNLEPA